MVSAGVNIDEGITDAYKDLKKNELKYIICEVPDNTSDVKLVSTGDNDKTFDEFKAELPEDMPRYVVFNLSW